MVRSEDNMTTVLDNATTSSQPMWTTLIVSMRGDGEVEPTKYRISPYAYEYKVNTVYLTLICIMAVTGFFGNLLVIGAVLVHKRLRVLSNAFIVNLAVADLCVSFFINTCNIIGILTKGVFFYDKPTLCKIVGSMCIISCCCSVWSVASIAVNRYVCICHRLIYPTIYNKRTLPFMILGIWTLCILIDLPSFFGWGDHGFDDKALFCTFQFDADYTYTLFFAFLLSVLPFSLLTYAYLRILMFSRATKKALKQVQNNVDMPAGTVIKTTDMRLLKSILTIWVVFGVLLMPYSVVALFDFDFSWNRRIYIFTILIDHLSSSSNSFIYGATNKNFRDGYVMFLRLIFCCGRSTTSKATAIMNSSTVMTDIAHEGQNTKNRTDVEQSGAAPKEVA